MNRRSVLALAALGLTGGGVAISPWSPLPWWLFGAAKSNRVWLVARLRAALIAGVGEEAVGSRLAAELELTDEAAAAKLVAGLSRAEVEHILESESALRATIEERLRADRLQNRIMWVNGWATLETEICVARLLVEEARA